MRCGRTRTTPAGRLVREVDFNGRAVAYTYDAAGRLIQRTNGAGEITAYVRDACGRVVERRSGEAIATFAYDSAGQLIAAVTAETTLTFERDAVGRVVSEECNGRAVRHVVRHTRPANGTPNSVGRRQPLGMGREQPSDPGPARRRRAVLRLRDLGPRDRAAARGDGGTDSGVGRRPPSDRADGSRPSRLRHRLAGQRPCCTARTRTDRTAA